MVSIMLIYICAIPFNSLLDVGNILYNRIFIENNNLFGAYISKKAPKPDF